MPLTETEHAAVVDFCCKRHPCYLPLRVYGPLEQDRAQEHFNGASAAVDLLNHWFLTEPSLVARAGFRGAKQTRLKITPPPEPVLCTVVSIVPGRRPQAFVVQHEFVEEFGANTYGELVAEVQRYFFERHDIPEIPRAPPVPSHPDLGRYDSCLRQLVQAIRDRG